MEQQNIGDREESDKEFLIKRFQDFPELLGYANFKTYETVTIVINSMVNIVFALSNIVYVNKILGDLFD